MLFCSIPKPHALLITSSREYENKDTTLKKKRNERFDLNANFKTHEQNKAKNNKTK